MSEDCILRRMLRQYPLCPVQEHMLKMSEDCILRRMLRQYLLSPVQEHELKVLRTV
jgi:hypothetical protein